MIPHIRNSIKALIAREGQVLMIRCRDEQSDFYILPGGGQNLQETMADALIRECREELGCLVQVGRLRYVSEYIHYKKDFAWQRGLHQIEFMFECTLPPGQTPCSGSEPDDIQVGVEWIPIERVGELRHYPEGLAKALRFPDQTPVYWGNTI